MSIQVEAHSRSMVEGGTMVVVGWVVVSDSGTPVRWMSCRLTGSEWFKENVHTVVSESLIKDSSIMLVVLWLCAALVVAADWLLLSSLLSVKRTGEVDGNLRGNFRG